MLSRQITFTLSLPSTHIMPSAAVALVTLAEAEQHTISVSLSLRPAGSGSAPSIEVCALVLATIRSMFISPKWNSIYPKLLSTLIFTINIFEALLLYDGGLHYNAGNKSA